MSVPKPAALPQDPPARYFGCISENNLLRKDFSSGLSYLFVRLQVRSHSAAGHTHALSLLPVCVCVLCVPARADVLLAVLPQFSGAGGGGSLGSYPQA